MTPAERGRSQASNVSCRDGPFTYPMGKEGPAHGYHRYGVKGAGWSRQRVRTACTERRQRTACAMKFGSATAAPSCPRSPSIIDGSRDPDRRERGAHTVWLLASHDQVVSFFEDFPGYVERRLPDGASGPPPGVIGGFVPWRIVLVRSRDAYAAVQDFEAFPSGALFELVLRVQDWDPDPSTRTHTVLRDPTSFRLGVRFSDGRAGASERFADRPREMRPEEVLLFPRAGSGHPHEYRQAFWLWPLPSAGLMRWISAWPEMDIGEQSVDVDASELVAAAESAERLWTEA